MAKLVKSGWLIPLFVLALVIGACSPKETVKPVPVDKAPDEVSAEISFWRFGTA